jgi:hypothetical protein
MRKVSVLALPIKGVEEKVVMDKKQYGWQI